MLTGVAPGEACTVFDSLSYLSGNVRSQIWFIEGGSIITLRHFLLKNSYVVLINNAFYSAGIVSLSDCIIPVAKDEIRCQIEIKPRVHDSTLYDYTCQSDDVSVLPFFSSPYRTPLRQFLNLTVYYDLSSQNYEFHITEYKWCLHILIKSVDDIRMLDRNLSSVYRFSPLSSRFPTLPKLKLNASASSLIDGTVFAEEMQQYMNQLLDLEGSAYLPDLLNFLELPVSLNSFDYHSPSTPSISDSVLFSSRICLQTSSIVHYFKKSKMSWSGGFPTDFGSSREAKLPSAASTSRR